MSTHAPLSAASVPPPRTGGLAWVACRVATLMLLVLALTIGQLGLSHPAAAQTCILLEDGELVVVENSYEPLEGAFVSLKPVPPGVDTRGLGREEGDGDLPVAALVPAQLPDGLGHGLCPRGPPTTAPVVHPALFVPFSACAPPVYAA